MELQGYMTGPGMAGTQGWNDPAGLFARVRVSGQDADADATFAWDLVRRTRPENAPSATAPLAPDTPKPSNATAQETTKAADWRHGAPEHLAHSLEKAVDFMRERFGDRAATAFEGILLSRGLEDDGTVTEDSLSKGLLEVLRFTDRTFGIPAGDALMAHFNQDLNGAMNQHFQNGLMERFYAAGGSVGAAVGAAAGGIAGGSAGPGQGLQAGVMRSLTEKFGQEAAAQVMDILQSAIEDGATLENLRQGLSEATSHLAEERGLNPDALPGLDELLGGPAASWGGAAGPAAKGLTLNLSV